MQICRRFIWIGTQDNKSNKSLVAWNRVCNIFKQGVLQITNLQCQNFALLMKCLWNLSGKAGNLQVRWVNCYYLKRKYILEYDVKLHNNWMFKGILKQRVNIVNMQQVWDKALQQNKFKVTNLYNCMIDDGNRVPWYNMGQYNKARPRAVVFLRMACHGKLLMRERLKRFGIIHDSSCVLCNTQAEFLNHLFFKCSKTDHIGRRFLTGWG